MSLIAIATVCSNNFLPGLKVLLQSFKTHNPQLVGLPVIVFYDPKKDIFNTNECHRIYENIIWRAIETDNYQIINFESSKKIVAQNSASDPTFRLSYLYSYYKYELFKLDYDKVIFLDSDLLILGDIKYLFDVDYDFAAVRETQTHAMFNAGVLHVGKKYLRNEKITNDLINLSYKGDTIGIDQPIINKYFDIADLPFEYNVLKFDYRHWGSWLSWVKILHYGGKKPWEPTQATGADLECSLLDKLWWDCYKTIG